MITQIQQDIEDALYEVLKKGGVGKEVIAKYPHQPVEELATVMAAGYKKSWVADVARCLDSFGKVENFEAMCNAAFRAAMLRVLQELREKP